MAGISFDDLIPQNGAQPQRGPVAPQGLSFDDLIPQQQQQQPSQQDLSGWANTLDTYGRGVSNAATFGFNDEIGAGARWLGGKVLPWQSNVTYDQALQEVRGSDDALAAAHPVADVAGQVTGTVGAGMGIMKAGLSPTARAIDAGRGLRAVSAASAAEGAAFGALQGAGQADGDLTNRAWEAGYGGVGGAALGVAIPGVTAALGGAARKVISPFLTNAERTQAVRALADEGVQLTAGQRTGNKGLQYAESELGGQIGSDIMERQGEQFTAAALRRTGTTANRATPEVIDDAFNRVGQQFDTLASRNQVMADQRLAQDLGGTWQEYASLVPESQRAPVVMDMIHDLGSRLTQGPLEGSAYQSARSRLDRMARGAHNDPQLQGALYGIRNSLDDAMERSMATANPGDVGAWREVRNSYRNLLTIEKAATGAGENAAQGLISPRHCETRPSAPKAVETTRAALEASQSSHALERRPCSLCPTAGPQGASMLKTSALA
jgi:hypothetical protein